MSVYVHSWEQKLLEHAHKAFESSVESGDMEFGEEILEAAYHYCESVTKAHSRTFYLASGLLPPAKRRAARALYAFCRISDDLVDNASGDPELELQSWKMRVLANNPPLDDQVAMAWADTRRQYRIPTGYAEQLLDGVARDIAQTRYDTFDNLTEYCYGVAATVGLMSMHIIGFSGPEAIPYAVKMGVALQLNNILRDVGEDWRAGRIYLPKEDLDAFGLAEEDIQAGCVDDRWRAFMDFQIERNRRLYAESMPGIALLHPDGRFAIAAAAELYRAILANIEANDWDVFNHRAYVSKWGKLRRLPGIWWRARNLSYSEGPVAKEESS
ncbi:phytoene/squalene synthase family protein [Candidatus Poribacteria bacterium]